MHLWPNHSYKLAQSFCSLRLSDESLGPTLATHSRSTDLYLCKDYLWHYTHSSVSSGTTLLEVRGLKFFFRFIYFPSLCVFCLPMSVYHMHGLPEKARIKCWNWSYRLAVIGSWESNFGSSGQVANPLTIEPTLYPRHSFCIYFPAQYQIHN